MRTCAICFVKISDAVGRSFHRLPLHNRDLYTAWLQAMRYRDANAPLHVLRKRDIRLCDEHFSPDDLIQGPENKLMREGAVPSIFPWTLVETDVPQGGTASQSSDPGPSSHAASDISEEQEDTPSLSLSCYPDPNPTESLDSDYSDGEQYTLQTPEMAPEKLEDCRQTLVLKVEIKQEEEDEPLGLNIKVIKEEVKEEEEGGEVKEEEDEVKEEEEEEEEEEDEVKEEEGEEEEEEQEVGDFSELKEDYKNHGDYRLLVIDTIRTLGKKGNGVSLLKIYDGARRASWFDPERGRTNLRQAISKLVKNKTLTQIKGAGVSFKLNKKKTNNHPHKYGQLVVDAIRTLGERNGSSLHKIHKEAQQVSWFDPEKGRLHLRHAICALVENKMLIQVKGVGAIGSFKLNKIKIAKNPSLYKKPTKEAKAKQSPTNKPTAKRTSKVQGYVTEVSAPRKQSTLGHCESNQARFPPALAQSPHIHPALAQAACFPPALAQDARFPPALAQDARQCISAPCTSVDSEHLFSADTRVVVDKRKIITCNKAEMLVFVRKNLPLVLKK